MNEISEMKVEDIDFQTAEVYIKNAKGGKELTTYITPVAIDHLNKYFSGRSKEDNVYLFYNHKHERMQPGGIRHVLKELAKQAGVENVHPHRFRRTFATKLAKRGMDIQEIQKLLGHRDINTTMQYICIDNDKMKSSYKKYIA